VCTDLKGESEEEREEERKKGRKRVKGNSGKAPTMAFNERLLKV
jgi:hypothetical protein